MVITSYLALSAILFSIGLYGVLTKKNAVMVLFCIELMFNAANINFVAFSKFGLFPNLFDCLVPAGVHGGSRPLSFAERLAEAIKLLKRRKGQKWKQTWLC